MSIAGKIKRHGLIGSMDKIIMKVKHKSGYTKWKFRHAPLYINPTADDLAFIELKLKALGVILQDCDLHPDEFNEFRSQSWFPDNYHGGLKSGVWDEKLLEHWVAAKRLGLMNFGPQDIYVDVAAASSPWARTLRQRKNVKAFAIDLLEVGDTYQELDFYRIENATATSFADASVSAVTLHCAYEMFMGEDDMLLISELSRILKPGGKAVILPLYMHTHYCAYSTPEYFGKGYSDYGAKEYVRLDCLGVPSSRKYDATKLKERVLDNIEAAGLRYNLLILRNKHEFGQGIYCHFILEIEK